LGFTPGPWGFQGASRVSRRGAMVGVPGSGVFSARLRVVHREADPVKARGNAAALGMGCGACLGESRRL